MAPSSKTIPLASVARVSVARRSSAITRIVKAVCVAICVCLLLLTFSNASVRFSKLLIVVGKPDEPYKKDGRVVRCFKTASRLQEVRQHEQSTYAAGTSPVQPPYSTTISFFVPVFSEHIFLYSRGGYDFLSSVKFELSENSSDDVEIQVNIGYFNNAALKRVQVCLLEDDDGGQGVGVFTPRIRSPNQPRQTDRLRFSATIRFPRSGTPENPLIIKSLKTVLPRWRQQLIYLEDRVLFRQLSIIGINASIHGDSVLADRATFTTINAPISGSYNVSKSLVLGTSNASITANIQLENHDGHNRTTLQVLTTDGHIRTPVTLVSNSKVSRNPSAFHATFITTERPLDVSFSDAPLSPFPLLEVVAMTSNAAPNIKLHPTYEGSIALVTKNGTFDAGVVQNMSTPDPSGQGRHRTVQGRNVMRWAYAGKVWWGNDPKNGEGKGTVLVMTSNSDNIIDLG